jgi:signal transduction histidine kinase
VPKEDKSYSLPQNFRKRFRRSAAENGIQPEEVGEPVSGEEINPPEQSAAARDCYVIKELSADSIANQLGRFAVTSYKYGADSDQTLISLRDLAGSLAFEMVAFYNKVNENQMDLVWKMGEISESGCPISLQEKVGQSDGFIGSTWQKRAPVFLEDLGGGSGQVRSFAGLPLFEQLEFKGALVFISGVPRKYSDNFKAILRNIAAVFEISLFQPVIDVEEKRKIWNFSDCVSLRSLNNKIVEYFASHKLIRHGGIYLFVDGNKVKCMLTFYKSDDDKADLKPFIDNYINDYQVKRSASDRTVKHPAEMRSITVDSIGTVNLLRIPLLADGREFAFMLIGYEREADRRNYAGEFRELSANMSGVLFNLLRIRKFRTRLEKMESNQKELISAERLRALGEMSSGVAHDFNNILAAIMGKTELLKESIADKSTREGLSFIESAAMDGAQVIKRIQDFARYQPASEPLKLDLNRVITETVRLTEHKWRSASTDTGRRIAMNTNLKSIPCIRGQMGELKEAFANLIFNSIDAMPDGGVISISTLYSNSRVHAIFSDTGVGMNEDIRKKIFEPFFTTKGPRGSGLGLSVAYGIIQSHRGEIRVESNEGEGTTITISFPAMLEDQQSRSRFDLQSTTQRVLVNVSDEDENERIKDLLSRSGYHAIGKDDNSDYIRKFKYDFLVLDFDAYRAQPDFYNRMLTEKDIYLVFLVSENQFGDLKKFIPESPRFRLIKKPYRNYEILLSIETAPV